MEGKRETGLDVQATKDRIATEMLALQTEYYGVPPREARCYLVPGEVCVVVLEETFTPAEKTLIARGEAEGIQDIRRRFQRVMANQFKSVVEQATGSLVRTFASETDLDNDVALEVFLLGQGREDMTAFEDEVEAEARAEADDDAAGDA